MAAVGRPAPFCLSEADGACAEDYNCVKKCQVYALVHSVIQPKEHSLTMNELSLNKETLHTDDVLKRGLEH